MKRFPTVTRLVLAVALLGSLSACTVVPVQPHGYYRAPPVVVETYPVYRYGYPQRHYGYDRRDDRYYRNEGRHYETPFDSAARTHRNIRRSLGLPRLPGMP